jgi:hypothetical protein
VVCILVRCIFRAAELFGGFDSSLANNETLFMLLDGTLMIIAVIMLTIAHPGLTLGEHWHTATFHLRNKKATAAAEKLAMLHSRDNSGINLQETARYERIEGARSPSPIPPNYEQTGQRYEAYRGAEP